MHDAKIVIMTVMENSLNVLPTIPCIKTIGIKTMASEIVIEITEGVISFALFIFLLEILVALIQAYIFTMLSALFIGMAVHQEH